MPRLPDYVKKDPKHETYYYRRTYAKPNGKRGNFVRSLGRSARKIKEKLPAVEAEFESVRAAAAGVQGINPDISLRDFGDIWLRGYVRKERCERERGTAEYRLAQCCEVLGGFPLRAINKHHAIQLCVALEERGLRPKTIKNYFGDLHCLFEYAIELEVFPPKRNPFKNAHPKIPKTIPRAVLSYERIEAVLGLFPPGDHRRMWILVARWTGQRWGDCRRLRWEHVRLKARLVGFEVGKTGDVLWLDAGRPLQAELRAELERQTKVGRGEFVLIDPPENAREITRLVRRELGFKLGVHDFRRFRTGELLCFGNAEFVRQTLQWSTTAMVRKYARVPEEHAHRLQRAANDWVEREHGLPPELDAVNDLIEMCRTSVE